MTAMREASITASSLSVTALQGLPLFAPGMSIAQAILDAAHRQEIVIGAGDVVVIAQKIVSKSEGAHVRLRDVEAGDEARKLAAQTGRAPALMQLVLDESAALLRVSPYVVIVRHHTGHVAANAGIDASNVEGGADDAVLLWPRDPDASARAIRKDMQARTGVAPAIVIADSLGRAWRMGTVGTAIGCSGLDVLDDQRGDTDLFGRTLQATLVAVADSVAAAAVLVMGEGAEGTPVAIVRGVERYVTDALEPGAIAGLRPLDQDLFR